MKIRKADYLILDFPSELQLRIVEEIGRTPYKSEENMTEDSWKKFLKKIIANGHEAMIEFADITVKFTVDRGVSHELVRHRLCSFAQESTRYCNYSKDKFGGEITFIDIRDHLSDPVEKQLWEVAMQSCENVYFELLHQGVSPQIARSVLPNSLKTEIVVKANLREWRKIFSLRTPITAHPQMREVMVPLLKELKSLVPIVFDDLEVEE